MPADPDNPNKKNRCSRITDQAAQLYFARVLPPARHYELSIHLINCEDCFPTVQKWGRLTGNGSVDIIGRILLEHRKNDARLISNDGTIFSLEQLFNQLFADNQLFNQQISDSQKINDDQQANNDQQASNERQISSEQQANNANKEQPTSEQQPSPPNINNLNNLARDLIRDKQHLMQQHLIQQIRQERAEIQETLETTLTTLAQLTREARCPRHQEIIALLKGQLFGFSWNILDTHLADCPDCQHYCLVLIDIYSWQKRQDLARRTAQQSQSDDSLASKSLATDSQAFKKGSMVTMSTTLSTTLTHQLSNTVSTVTTSPSRGQLAAALATLLLLGGVGYYFSLPPTSPPSSTITGVIKSSASEDIKQDLLTTQLESLQQQPLSAKIFQEIEQLIKQRETEKAQVLIPALLRQAEATGDKVAQAKLLYFQGRIFSQTGNFPESILILQKAIQIAKSLNNPELLTSPLLLLANIYHFTDQNATAAEQARQCLQLAQTTNQPLAQALSLQIIAISELFAYDSSESEDLVKQSIAIAQQHEGYEYVLQGFNYLGIINTERGQYQVAKKYFERALAEANNVPNSRQRAILQFTVQGYYARSQALAGNINKAVTLYVSSIQLAQQLDLRQRLALSQLNYGLGECLKIQGNGWKSEKALLRAKTLEEQAHKDCEINNTFMSFSIKRKAARRCN
jgi:tetratricopeptide (TPR) repeat protein